MLEKRRVVCCVRYTRAHAQAHAPDALQGPLFYTYCYHFYYRCCDYTAEGTHTHSHTHPPSLSNVKPPHAGYILKRSMFFYIQTRGRQIEEAPFISGGGGGDGGEGHRGVRWVEDLPAGWPRNHGISRRGIDEASAHHVD